MSTGKSGIGIYIDLINSRKIKARNDLEAHVKNLQDYFLANNQYGIFSIWKGLDEFIIISPNWEFAVKTIVKVQELLHPYEQRFVITVIQNVDASKPVHEMDNMEFAVLAEGMDHLKKTQLNVDIVPAEHDKMLDSLVIVLNLFIFVRSSFTKSQMEIYCLNKLGKYQLEIAEQIKKSQQYVSRTLNGIQAGSLNLLEEKLYQMIAHGFNKGNFN